MILQNRNWKMAMRTSDPHPDKFGNTVIDTPLRLLIKYFPDLAKIVFDKCMHKVCTCETQVKDCSICENESYELDYEFLDDMFYWNENTDPSSFEHFTYSPKKQKEDNSEKRKRYKLPYHRSPMSCE